MRTFTLIALGASAAFAQQFDVASIKVSKPGNPGMSMHAPPGRIVLENVTLRYLVNMAWGLHDHQISGLPDWADSAHFDIEAKSQGLSSGTPEGMRQRSLMLQALVADRFGLVFHRETKDLPIYALVIAKGGPKLIASAAGSQGGSTSSGSARIQGKGMPTRGIAEMLSSSLNREVIDETGLIGLYDFTLKWSPDLDEKASDGPSLFTAIQEQLGLKLESRKGPVEMFVVDRVQKPSEN